MSTFKVLHAGRTNRMKEYITEGKNLVEVQEEQDLGVIDGTQSNEWKQAGRRGSEESKPRSSTNQMSPQEAIQSYPSTRQP